MKNAISQLIAGTLCFICFSIAQARDPSCSPAPAQLQGAIQRSEVLIEQMIEATEEKMAVAEQYGMAVAVSVCGEIVWTDAYGYADLEHTIPVTSRTRFRVGSVSKTFTSAALGQLAEQGKLDWDTEVQIYATAFPTKRFPVSVRQVAGHIGGIRHYADDDEFLSDERYDSVNDALSIFSDDPLINKPGSEYYYSSYGWNLLSAVVEGASGEPFLGYMQAHVFRPAGMDDTVADDNRRLISGRTGFYEFNDDDRRNRNAPYVDNSNKWAGGGFLSTPADLLRFGHAMYNGTLVSRETQTLLVTGMKTSSGAPTRYGIGWATDMLTREIDRASAVYTDQVLERTRSLVGDQRIAGHSGGSVGGLTLFLTTPDQDGRVMIAATSNNSSIFPVFALPVFAEFVGIAQPKATH